MDRRFICETCGIKWHVPAARTDMLDPERCGSCDGALVPFIAPAGPAWDEPQGASAASDGGSCP